MITGDNIDDLANDKFTFVLYNIYDKQNDVSSIKSFSRVLRRKVLNVEIMKKFCNRLTKPQWRLTVPNFSPMTNHTSANNARKSGSYDLEEAQRQYDRSRSLPNSVYVVESDTSCSDNEEIFEDARASHQTSDGNIDQVYLDSELYVDLEQHNNNTSRKISNSAKYHYDVPRISFQFFEQQQNATYENQEFVNPEIMKSEVKIVLTHQPPLPLIKSGSDPNLAQLRHKPISDDDEHLYKVPRNLNSCRFSQSLHDFNMEDFANSGSILDNSHSSIEHVSCSQIIPQENSDTKSSERTPSRFSVVPKLHRPTFLKRPPADTLSHWRSKFQNMMQEQAVGQRVGAYAEKEKISINFEEMMRSSKLKCRKAFQSTTNLFKRTSPNSETSDTLPKTLTNKDIQYKFDASSVSINTKGYLSDENNVVYVDEEKSAKGDFSSIRSAISKRWNNRMLTLPETVEGQNGFDDLRRFVKQGGDFCKELALILQERAETEAQYAKNLSKLSAKLSKACRDNVGGLNEAWKAVAVELETRAEIHRIMGQALLDETAKPLKSLTETQHRTRKQCESIVDKAAKSLSDWRGAEAKGKKTSHSCARENEKLQDAAVLDTNRSGKLTLSRSTSFIQLAHKEAKNNNIDKENAKLEGKKKKAEDNVKKADIEYYTLCVKAERARLEWESAVLRGVNTFQSLEEERLSNLKVVLSSYLRYQAEQGPRLIEISEKLKSPISEANPQKDLTTFVNLRQSAQQVSEQLLPDFYCEHITLAMNRERRKQALIKLLHLIRQDIERERKSKNGLEKLSKAIKQTPNFGAEDSQQSVSEKLYHMKSMLTYLEGARYKLQNALAELDSEPRSGHPLQQHITITRDKSGLQQSVLKVPQWLREDWLDETTAEKSPVSEKSIKSHKSDNSDPHNNDIETDWATDRGAADGNSNQPDSDFDEFSSQCSSNNHCINEQDTQAQPIAQCKALYAYIPKLSDELALQPGDFLSVYQQQDDGWWFGECRGNYGTFPATYVELINSN